MQLEARFGDLNQSIGHHHWDVNDANHLLRLMEGSVKDESISLEEVIKFLCARIIHLENKIEDLEQV